LFILLTPPPDTRLSKKIGHKLHIKSFLRVQCGEGIAAADKTGFAEEVAKMAAV
jgi:hypothetical protein